MVIVNQDTNLLKFPVPLPGLIVAIAPPEKSEVVQPDFFRPESHTSHFSGGLQRYATPIRTPSVHLRGLWFVEAHALRLHPA